MKINVNMSLFVGCQPVRKGLRAVIHKGYVDDPRRSLANAHKPANGQ